MNDKKNLIILALAVAFATTMIVSVSQKNLYTGHGVEKGFYTLNTKTGGRSLFRKSKDENDS